MNIFVGNLSFDVKEADLKQAFMAFGTVLSASIVMEKKGLKSRGFGFVQMPDEQEALGAIEGLNGQEILGRPVNVLPAISKAKVPAAKKDGQDFTARPDKLQQVGFAFKRTGKYRQGRRSLSYAKKRALTGLPEPVVKRKHKSNPLRWRKRTSGQSRFTEFKPKGEFKSKEEFKPRGEFYPKGEFKPRREFKPKGEFKSKEEFKLREEFYPKGEFKPKERSKPWIKSGKSFRPWHKKIYEQSKSKFKKRSR